MGKTRYRGYFLAYYSGWRLGTEITRSAISAISTELSWWYNAELTFGEGLHVVSNQMKWTNKSVLKFAGSADPIGLIEAKARELVLLARDAGWSGPPYNPLAIADLLKIPVEANGEVFDARTVPAEAGVRIEFNPTRPRERVRFSIAHEIAHTLFSDVGEQTRHRGGTAITPDEWQLEMLCNLAAAEFVMPLGSLPSSSQLPKLEQLLVDRRKFDVSTEAFLLRVVKVQRPSRY